MIVRGFAVALLLVSVALSRPPSLEADQDPFRPLTEPGGVAGSVGYDATATEADGTTALHRASLRNDVESVDALIEAGADVNAANELGATALWAASLNGSAAVVDRLLAAGADPNAALRQGETPLMVASRSGNPVVVEALLSHGADPNDRGPREQTALMWAAAQRHADVVALLLEHGANVHARSATWRLFMAQPPAPHPQHRGWFEHGGNSALMFAARVGDVASVRHLVAAGADVNDRNAWGLSALAMAAFANIGPIVIRVNTEPAPYHVGGREEFGTGEFVEVVELLLSRGADPNLGASQFTALHAAVMRRDDDVVDLLLSHGANPNLMLGAWTPQDRGSGTDYYFHRAWVGATPVWLAARFSTPYIVRRLVEYGADPTYIHRGEHYSGAPGGELSALERDVASPLMAAVGMSRTGRAWVFQRRDSAEHEAEALEKVKLLVGLGVDVNAVDHQGRTALDGAIENEYETIVAYLREAGAERGNRMPSG